MELISDEYKQVLIKEHELTKWGMSGCTFKDFITEKCQKLNIDNILDYGSGQGLLKKALEPNISVTNYDPGIVDFSILPDRHNFVVCMDVLEHVEEDYVDNVINHLHSLTGTMLLVTVATTKALRILNNGVNAHITIKDINWWEEKFLKHFNIVGIEHGYVYVLEPK